MGTGSEKLCQFFIETLEDILGMYGYLFIGVVVSLSSTAIIGVFGALQKKELAGDAVAHATLPGLARSFIITGLKAPLCMVSRPSAHPPM